MKFTLKLLLFLCIVFAGIYATTPLWLPYAFERQLPPGWQLESMDAAYPDLSGIDVHTLRLNGGLPAADLAIAATGLRYTYRDGNVEVDSASLEIGLQATENRSIDTFTPEKLVVNLEALQLNRRVNGSYHITSDAAFEYFPDARGYIEVDSSPDSLSADIRFPNNLNSPPWLDVRIERKDKVDNTFTSVQAVLDSEPVNQDWLDSMLKFYSAGFLTRVKGKLEIRTAFTGLSLQEVEHLSLATENLVIVSKDGILDINANLAASHDGKDINVDLPTAVEIQFQDKTGKIDLLLNSTIPELQRAPRSDAVALLMIESNSRFRFNPGTNPSLSYSGAIGLDLAASGETIRLHSDNMSAVITEPFKLESLKTVGLITVDWQEKTSVAYISDDLELKAEELSVTGEIAARNGKYIGKGSGSLTDIQIARFDTAARNIELEWQDLDLLNLAGKLSTRTQGLSIVVDAETWTGFDFDANYRLLNGTGVNGLGKLKFDSGWQLPLKFAGNTDTNKWEITLPRNTISMQQLTKLIALTHIELPESVKLTGGSIGLHGKVVIDERVTASLDITGREIDASMLENRAMDAGFSFETTYDDTISANGPISIEAIALASGFDVTDIKADFQLVNTDTYRLKNLQAVLFGGQLELNRLQYSSDMLEDTTAELSHISLGRLLEFADFDGLKGTGSLDISLPVSTDQTGLNIKDGLFHSTVPGYLAYTREDVAGSNIGLQALENFQYQDLSGEINYQSDGSYQIAVHLEGNNPDLYGGHPVVFNLNINGILPELFEALFITGDFEEAILKEIRKH